MIEVNGYQSKDKTIERFPTLETLLKPKAIIECYQQIPCNPCETSCPFEAITIGNDINHTPVIDFSKCTGCANCVSSCPGLAIMVVSVKDDQAHFKIPYEMLPKPKPGDVWLGVNRKGKVICDATITHVSESKKTDRTSIISVSVPKQYLYEFITIRSPL